MTVERLNILTDKYLFNAINAEELRELHFILQEPAMKSLAEERLLSQLINNEYRVDTNLNILQEKINKRVSDVNLSEHSPAHRVHFLKTSWFRYAAAIVLVFGAAAYLWLANKKIEQPLANNDKQLQTEIMPGGQKAILILADGSTIILDSAANGAIAQQGNTAIVKLANGQIVYNLKGLSEGKVMMNTMATPRGGQYQLTLPDGTKVWLNAASSITYPAVFAGKQRNVKVTGEIYFEVAKNQTKPFVVDIDGKSWVQVLGTNFNINSYNDEGNIKTTLLEGSIKVSHGSFNVILKPGQQATLNDAAHSVNSVDPDLVMAWKNGLFNFNGANLPIVMRQLERWYDIHIKYEGSMPDIVFEGKMDRGVRLNDMFEFFTKMHVGYRMEGRTLILSNN